MFQVTSYRFQVQTNPQRKTLNLKLFFFQQTVNVINIIKAVIDMKVKLWDNAELFSDF